MRVHFSPNKSKEEGDVVVLGGKALVGQYSVQVDPGSSQLTPCLLSTLETDT